VKTSSGEYFSEVADIWDELRATYFSESVRDKAITLSGAKGMGIAADIGAGTGFMSEGLLNLGLTVIAVDESPEMLSVAKNKLGSNLGAEFRLGSAEKIPIEDESVDYAFANMMLHHSETPELAVREMARIVRPGGAVVVTDLDEHDAVFLRTEHHDRWMGLGRDAVRTWFRFAGLEEISVTGIGENCCTTSDSGEVAAVSIFAAVGRKPAHKIIK
jgi:ubiquinone/menaquinone biosynthesis C-methylase UbiE